MAYGDESQRGPGGSGSGGSTRGMLGDTMRMFRDKYKEHQHPQQQQQQQQGGSGGGGYQQVRFLRILMCFMFS